MPTYTDDRIEDIAGGALADPYVTREGDVAASAFVSHRRVGPVVVKGTGPATLNGVGVVLDTAESWTGKLVSIRNEGVEKAYIDKDGTYKQNVVWDDVLGPANDGIGAAALTAEAYRDTPAVVLFMRNNENDSLTFHYQMPHRWKKDTEVRVHAHLVPMVTPVADQNVQFVCTYAWAHAGQELPAVTSWATATVDMPVPADGTKTFKEQLLHLAATTPTGSAESSILIFHIYRNSTSTADSYTQGKVGGTAAANLAVLAVDAHVQIEKLGTGTEIPS